MKNLKEFNSKIEFVLTDIDDTITTDGQLHSNAYAALWKLSDAGLKVIPITGRPAGWCEMIARFWPVVGIVGENGGFYFRYLNKKMNRWFFADDKTMIENRKKLDQIQSEILKNVPGCAISSDQFCRLMDLAVDFCEDVPKLPESEIQKIVQTFKTAGAQAKISSIHVNGWFGNYDKLTTTFQFLKTEYGLSEADILKKCAFVGDSPNDEPMFEKFPHSFGVANILDFQTSIKNLPTYVAIQKGGDGFAEITAQILKSI
ncbi:MAG: HAD-IIB family hydrolase [Bdellovibrio sp.]|nr:HAD-IIB family hydrolase [Bdellovibrio sp.]